jgi:hypothetical protein
MYHYDGWSRLGSWPGGLVDIKQKPFISLGSVFHVLLERNWIGWFGIRCGGESRRRRGLLRSHIASASEHKAG